MATCPEGCDCECLQNSLDTLIVRDDELFAGIEAVEADVAAIDASWQAGDAALQSQITSNDVDITTLDGRVTVNEADILAIQNEAGMAEDDIRRWGAETAEGDDTQNCADFVEAAIAGTGSAFIPEGTWYFLTSAILPNFSRVHGVGMGISICKFSGANTNIHAAAGTSSYPMFRSEFNGAFPAYQLSEDIRIKGITMDGNGDNQTDDHTAIVAFTFYGKQGVVEDCEITGFRGGWNKEAFFLQFSGTSLGAGYDCHARNCLFSGVAGQMTGTSGENTCILFGGYDSGATPAEGLSNNCSVTGCTFRDMIHNGTTYSSSVHCIAPLGHGHKVSGNRVYDCTGSVTFVWLQTLDTNHLTVENNHCEDAKYFVSINFSDEVFDRITIRGNKASNVEKGFFIFANAGATGTFSNILIENNIFLGSTGSIISFDAGDVADPDPLPFTKITVIHNELECQAAWPEIIYEYHVHKTAGVNQPDPDEWVVGDNRRPTMGRAWARPQELPYIPRTWLANTVWPEYTNSTSP